MASGFPSDAVRQINRLFLGGSTAALTDGQLLERFTTRRAEVAESAFEAIVRRHGPMVLRVVKGVLRDTHDIDDAFQATFLVLVRKAATIREGDLLGPWLYGVAHRVARKTRGVVARRQKREGGVIDDPPADSNNNGPWLDLRPILDEELNRLPEKYRKPVVLCHLQGLTHSEAAQELAWPVGTVSVRLARARKILKERLTRRGMTVTAGLWAAGLSIEGASAAVPELLIRSTTMAALQAATGKLLAAGAVSAGSMILTKRTLTTMLISRLKWVVVSLALGLGATAGVLTNRQIMISSAKAQAQADTALAAAKTAKLPAARSPVDPDSPPFPPAMGTPSPDQAGDSFSDPLARPEPKVEDPLVPRKYGLREINPIPPGYFDLPVSAKNDGTDPPLIKRGQVLMVEVLEALPGRPITGERVVRPDGTISLGFYGDLPVAGLNRHQVKVKLIELLRKFVNDEVLGLIGYDSTGTIMRVIPPVESNRVSVDESSNYFPPGHERSAQPVGKTPSSDPASSNDQVGQFEQKIDMLVKELEQLRAELRAANTPAKPPTTPEKPPG